MKKYLLTFVVSTAICILAPFAFWHFNSKTYLSDYFFLSGNLFFVIGMIIALFATSRWHYYRHIKDKMKGKAKDDSTFEKDEKKRKEQTRFGIIIAISGIIAFALSGYLALK